VPSRFPFHIRQILTLTLLGASALLTIGCEESSTDASAPSAPAALPGGIAGAVLEKFLEVNRWQQAQFHNSSMDVEIEGRFPKLKREASYRGVRRIGNNGEITYDAINSEGDGMIRKEVIAKYITAEIEASASLARGNGKLRSIAISPDNYRFRYRGTFSYSGRQAHVFQLTPRQNRLGLFRGEVWIDAETFQTLRETGTLVKNPSIYLRKVQFDRKYELQGGVAIPTQVWTRIDTRLGLLAELDVRLKNFNSPLMAQSGLCPLGW
jgi:hypothetical protein